MDGMDPIPALVPPPAQTPLAQPTAPSLLRRVFFNDLELRAGWRFLIFLIILLVVSFGANFVIRHLVKAPSRRNQPVELRASIVIASDGANLLLLLGVTAIMAGLEKRKLRHYGLPLQDRKSVV